MGVIGQDQQGPHMKFIVSSTSNSHPKLIFINLQKHIKNSWETFNPFSCNRSAHRADQQLQHRHQVAAVEGPAKNPSSCRLTMDSMICNWKQRKSQTEVLTVLVKNKQHLETCLSDDPWTALPMPVASLTCALIHGCEPRAAPKCRHDVRETNSMFSFFPFIKKLRSQISSPGLSHCHSSVLHR